MHWFKKRTEHKTLCDSLTIRFLRGTTKEARTLESNKAEPMADHLEIADHHMAS